MFSFFVSDLKIVYYKNYESSVTMPWTREENIFSSHLIWKQYRSKLWKQNFAGSLTLENCPQKIQFYRWLRRFQATRSANNLNKKAENPRRGKKLTARCPENMETVRDSVRSPKNSLSKMFSGTWSFICTVG